MRVRVVLFTLFLCASAGWSAELHTLKGDVVKGNLESITDKEIVIAQGTMRITTPLAQVLKLDLSVGPPVKLDGKYSDVELTDGSLFHCKEFHIKGKEVQLKLLAGQEIKLPLSAVTNILINAEEEKYRRDWTERVAKKRRRDVIAMRNGETVSPFEGTLGNTDAKGKAIEFQTAKAKRLVDFANPNLHGLIFQRELDPLAPPVLCKLSDNYHDFLMVSSVAKTPTGLKIKTPAGASLEFAMEQVTLLDYSHDKLAFLSHMKPSKIKQESNFDFVDTYRENKNLDNGPLRVYGDTYALGLALHAHTELEYDLKGDYREFHALAGIDESVGGIGGPVVLVIEGVVDGQVKELYKKTFTRKDSKVKKDGTIELNIKDVQTLRIIVRTGDMFDNGKHLDLVNAKVQK